ncbi:urease isoform X1 [Tanacetum coccineum]
MKLSPWEVQKLMLHNAGFLAQKRLARGSRLNYTEAVALIATQKKKALMTNGKSLLLEENSSLNQFNDENRRRHLSSQVAKVVT